ncbi:hypothetical protein BS17DRAFT_770880 [Gyrodon lividus]|nr:hypothetical protein BS17DRAFT_770880 [Gyrodon lividus]
MTRRTITHRPPYLNELESLMIMKLGVLTLTVYATVVFAKYFAASSMLKCWHPPLATPQIYGRFSYWHYDWSVSLMSHSICTETWEMVYRQDNYCNVIEVYPSHAFPPETNQYLQSRKWRTLERILHLRTERTILWHDETVALHLDIPLILQVFRIDAEEAA